MICRRSDLSWTDKSEPAGGLELWDFWFLWSNPNKAVTFPSSLFSPWVFQPHTWHKIRTNAALPPLRWELLNNGLFMSSDPTMSSLFSGLQQPSCFWGRKFIWRISQEERRFSSRNKSFHLQAEWLWRNQRQRREELNYDNKLPLKALWFMAQFNILSLM